MLNQIDLLTYIANFTPIIIKLIFYILILIFAIFILRGSSYRYAITLMIASILLITKEIIYLAIQYPFLAYRLQVEMGLPMVQIAMILTVWNTLFMSIEITGGVLLVVSVYLIYKIHLKEGKY